MALGLAKRFDILAESPLDSEDRCEVEAASSNRPESWVPSRYTVRAVADDGRLVLWNTLSGKLTVFADRDRPLILDLLGKKGFDAPREGTVEYLVDRGYLVRRGVDELRQFQRRFGEQHYRSDVLELILLASEDCNLRCTYCYEDFARGTMTPDTREGIKKLVRRRIKKLNRLSIDWFGGEPLYGWEALEDLAPFFLDVARENDVILTNKMTTNGYLLNPETVDKLFAWRIRAFQVTIDGLPEFHDRSRPARDGSPTFERIFGNLEAMAQREASFRVILRINFDQANHEDVPRFIDRIENDLGEDPRFQLRFHPVGKWGGPRDAQLDVCGMQDATAIKRELTALAHQKGLYFDNFKMVSQVGSQACYAARPYNLLIGATGKVMKCTIMLDKDDANVIGRLAPDGSLELDDDRMALWTEPAFEQDAQCRKCVVLPTCQGIHCPMIRIQQDTQPCCPSRANFKTEMLDGLRYSDREGRMVRVGAHGGSPQ